MYLNVDYFFGNKNSCETEKAANEQSFNPVPVVI